MRIIH